MKAKQRPGVVFQPRVHHSLQRGIHQMVSALRPTLGPLGGGVAIDHLNDTNPLPEYLADGGVIARRIIELRDRDEDVGAMLVRSMILRQHERVGDGTATAAVLFEAIFNAGVRYIAAGGNAMQLRRHLERAIPCITDALDGMASRLEGQDALERMALSLCHDEEMAALLGESFDLVGEYGRVEIREGYGRRLHREYVEGSHFYGGAVSRALLPETADAMLRLESPAIFLSDYSIEDHRDLFPVLRAANDANVNGLVIVARDLSEKAVALLTTHNRMDKFKVVAVRLPGLNPEDRMAALDDLSVMTGASPFVQVAGMRLESLTKQAFGSTRRFWAEMHSFGFVGGGGEPRRLREHVQRLKSRCGKAQDVDERKRLHARIGNLLGGALTLWVGGYSQPEISARKALAERTALALRSAVEEGVAPGGGIALMDCGNMLAGRFTVDPDQRAAYRILAESLSAPARTLFRNAGYDPGDVLGRLSGAGSKAVFDVLRDVVVDAREAGILDGVTVLKACVRNAISTAALALTIDSVVHLARPEMVGKPE